MLGSLMMQTIFGGQFKDYMTTALTINGATFLYPDPGDTEWGSQASGWALAVTNGFLPRIGGTFILTGEIDFGSAFGIKLVQLNLGTDGDYAEDNILAVNSDQQLTLNNVVVGSTSVAGANTEVQYNNAGAFGASSRFTYDVLTNTLTIGG